MHSSNSANLWHAVKMGKQKLSQEGVQATPKKKRKDTTLHETWSHKLWTRPIQTLTPYVCRVYIVLAYLGLALSGTHAAVINLGMLNLPFFTYASFVFLIGIASFASSIVDWIISHVRKPNRYSAEKVKSIEIRFFLHNPYLRQIKAHTKIFPQALSEFADYAYLEKQIRKQVKRSLVHDNQIYNDEFATYPVELQARSILAEKARNSRDHREAIIKGAKELTDSYRVLSHLILSGRGKRLIQRMIPDPKERDLSQKEISHILADVKLSGGKYCALDQLQQRDKPSQQTVRECEIDTDLLAIHMVYRFSYFTVGYYRQLFEHKSTQLSNDDLIDYLQVALTKYIDKRIKKECELSYATKEISIIANVLAWGSALITNTLTVVASAPIKLLSGLSTVDLEPALCVWFYLSGCLIGISVENAKKFLARMYHNIIETDYQRLAPLLNDKVFRFRLFLVIATGISSCYFSMFSIARLIKSPQQHGAEIVIDFLSKWLIPQIWPCIVPIWVVFTLTAAMMNLYKDSKFYSKLEQKRSVKYAAQHLQTSRSERLHCKLYRWATQLCTKKNLNRCLRSLILATTSLAMALTYHITVVKLTVSVTYGVILSTCVFFMSYAKHSLLHEKIVELLSGDSSVNKIKENYNWHREPVSRRPSARRIDSENPKGIDMSLQQSTVPTKKMRRYTE